MKQVNETVGRMGAALRQARQACRMTHDEVAVLLGVMPSDLAEYERGITVIPFDVLRQIFVMGYKMIEVRAIEKHYRCQRKVFRRIKNIVSDMAE